ncbi:hypothetical protein W97_02040 [Coniosporium apollinis CBS 100218]|uniref:Flavoprotein domain-containing protein n=1 Tax=Coniosporium apollinis (strain CBS 100218) TaxID=1168221 RepID=R7YLM7_CONA1|nr:uncharacterized protein W97_02040 [Coniosporium apollinis CBS 100218]EON62815.1 hypothetical protein W97_02040 [Coniosporium apollinis CBS 100218]
MSAYSDLPPPQHHPTPGLPSPRPLTYNSTHTHLLLCATGSVATIKLPSIISSLSHHPALSIRLILTPAACTFLAGQSTEQPSLASVAALPNVDGIYTDEDEWRTPWTRGAKILHIELRRWADLMVIAPLSANSLAKIVGGWAEGLVCSVVRAWDTTGEIDPVRLPPRPGAADRLENAGSRERESGSWGEGLMGGGIEAVEGTHAGSRGRGKKIVLVAPAMNTAMWKHPITRQHMRVLEKDWNVSQGGWFEVLSPMQKELACGDTGDGAMKDWKEIVSLIEERLGLTASTNGAGG